MLSASTSETQTKRAARLWGLQPMRNLKSASGASKQAGMDDCLFKPISLILLSQRLSTLEPPPSSAEILNVETLYSLAGRNGSQLKLLLEELVRSNRLDLKALLALNTTDGLEPFKGIAHRIKGAAKIVGAHDLIIHCEELEHAELTTLQVCSNTVQLAMRTLERALLRELARLNEGT